MYAIPFRPFVWRLLEPEARVNVSEDVGVGHGVILSEGYRGGKEKGPAVLRGLSHFETRVFTLRQ